MKQYLLTMWHSHRRRETRGVGRYQRIPRKRLPSGVCSHLSHRSLRRWRAWQAKPAVAGQGSENSNPLRENACVNKTRCWEGYVITSTYVHAHHFVMSEQWRSHWGTRFTLKLITACSEVAQLPRFVSKTFLALTSLAKARMSAYVTQWAAGCRTVVPKLVRTVTQIKVAIMSYYPPIKNFCIHVENFFCIDRS